MTALAMVGITKTYGGTPAVRAASAEFERGLVHAVVGENGAGKSTLLKIGAGVVTPDEGEIRVDGARLAPHTAEEAIRRGVAMVMQHFALVDVFTVLENVMLGAEPMKSGGRLDRAAARAKAESVAAELGMPVQLDARVGALGVGDRQRVEIVRALFRDARVLILDEPTAVLTPGEAAGLYATLRRLAAGGRAIVVVTHKLDEVQLFCDRVTVMRRGEVVLTRDVARGAAEERALAEAIMGATLPDVPSESRAAFGAPGLEVSDVALGRALAGVTFAARAGEIVGIAGVEGNGQTELVRVLAGLDAPDAGRVRIGGGRAAVVHGDRHREGLVLDASVAENALLGELGAFSRYGVIDLARERAEAGSRLAAADVVPLAPDLPARALSGGNQQKVVMARAVAAARRGAAVLVLAHPTRGVDLRARRAIHDRVRALRRAGHAIVVVSSDLAELRALADRILVLARGRIVAELPPDAADDVLGRAMLAGVA